VIEFPRSLRPQQQSDEMNPTQIELLQASFRTLQPMADEAARLFYDRLFEMDPSLRPMFRGNMQEQGRKLMQMIGMAVGALHRLDQLLPAIENLSRQHAGYGVRNEHYITVGAALLGTLDITLGEAFTPEVRAAWTAMYEAVSLAMQRGADVMSSAA
jgi:hemoglobin-like flavoprotein